MQGYAFPYTRGMWLVSNLVAAINPDDLDALDESLPLSRFTLQGIIGRTLSQKEYEFYFHGYPSASKYADIFDRFLNDETHTKNIIPEEDREIRDEGKCTVM